jgi:hypothetical protein
VNLYDGTVAAPIQSEIAGCEAGTLPGAALNVPV